MKQLELIFSEYFDINGAFKVTVVEQGKINDTYRIYANSKNYYLQKINKNVFENPLYIMENLTKLIACDTKMLFPILIKSKGGDDYVEFDGEIWRLFAEAGVKINVNKLTDIDYWAIGYRAGQLHEVLEEVESKQIHDTLIDYHSISKRYCIFMNAISKASKPQVESCRDLLNVITERYEKATIIEELLDEGKLQRALVHNDLTLNNMLWNSKLCNYTVIDLDTVMKGSRLYDVGELIRNAAKMSDNKIDIKKCNSIIKGYLEIWGDKLQKVERSLFAQSIWTMSYLLAIRYLTDAFNGNKYFKVKYQQQNIDRANERITLMLDIEKKWNEIL